MAGVQPPVSPAAWKAEAPGKIRRPSVHTANAGRRLRRNLRKTTTPNAALNPLARAAKTMTTILARLCASLERPFERASGSNGRLTTQHVRVYTGVFTSNASQREENTAHGQAQERVVFDWYDCRAWRLSSLRHLVKHPVLERRRFWYRRLQGNHHGGDRPAPDRWRPDRRTVPAVGCPTGRDSGQRESPARRLHTEIHQQGRLFGPQERARSGTGRSEH